MTALNRGIGLADNSFGRIGYMSSPDEFIKRCVECLSKGGNADDIAELTRQALRWQRESRVGWGKAELLHCSDDLMIVDLTLPPFATSAIHEHKTWAVIGISEGCEVDELFEERDGRLAPTTRHELRPDDVLVLSPDCIHFIGNPMAVVARGIHVYGRNLSMTDRRMWHPETATPQAMDFAEFEQWERALTRRSEAHGLIMAPAVARA